MNDVDPAILVAIYLQGGRDALIEHVSIKNENAKPINGKMHEIVDVFIDAVEGRIDHEKATQKITFLQNEMRTIVEDLTLDMYNDKSLSKDEMNLIFNELDIIDEEIDASE